MGEIGIPRREFLYDIRVWEVRRIIRGYRRRHRLTHQLLAECVYAATFSMRDPQGKTVEAMFPSLVDDDGDDSPPITDEEAAELSDMIASMNAS